MRGVEGEKGENNVPGGPTQHEVEKKKWHLGRTIIDRLSPYLLQQAHPALLDSLFWAGPPDEMPKREAVVSAAPSVRDTYWADWFRSYVEIMDTLDRLNECLIYLDHFPTTPVFRIHGISEASWMQYHVEMYLNEEYILSRRLIAFLRKIERMVRRKGNLTVSGQLKNLEKRVFEGFRYATTTRGQHVHQKRWKDPEISDLASLAFLGPKMKQLTRRVRRIRKIKYNLALSRWKKELSQNNKVAIELSTIIFDAVENLLVKYEP
ncbi:MAG TPA: hypothetical protein VEX69_05730 [Candidatus Limnocylindria bacterium]|nr:hypothetical protein [Candidatus Limnocylindria bacterium]